MLGFDDGVDEGGWDFFRGKVVGGEGGELRRGPAPVFEHLGGGLDKVTDDGGSVKARVFCYGHKVVDTVAKFVEESGLYTIK